MRILILIAGVSALTLSACATAPTATDMGIWSSPDGSYKTQLVSAKSGVDKAGGPMTTTLLSVDNTGTNVLESGVGLGTLQTSMPSMLDALVRVKESDDSIKRMRARRVRPGDNTNIVTYGGVAEGGDAVNDNFVVAEGGESDSYSRSSAYQDQNQDSYLENDVYLRADADANNDNYVRTDIEADNSADLNNDNYIRTDVENDNYNRADADANNDNYVRTDINVETEIENDG